MKKQLLLKFLVTILVYAINFFNMQEVKAQYNPLFGNSYGAGSNMQIQVGSAGSSVQNPYIHMFGSDSGISSAAGSINLVTSYNPIVSAEAFSVSLRTDASNSAGYPRVMQIFQSGQVLFGNSIKPTSRPNYKLAVAGELVAQSLYITNPNNWADYVFAPDYKLLSLKDLETYLQQNKHLPAIPSAKEVESSGYNLAEMDAKLLQTIEELTLQVIKLHKEMEQLKSSLDNKTTK